MRSTDKILYYRLPGLFLIEDLQSNGQASFGHVHFLIDM